MHIRGETIQGRIWLKGYKSRIILEHDLASYKYMSLNIIHPIKKILLIKSLLYFICLIMMHSKLKVNTIDPLRKEAVRLCV